MRIAIIGSGISGLTAAYHLQHNHDLTVFEAGGHVGGHTNTLDIEFRGERQRIDTGFIVFNDWTYPNFIGLLDELAVPSQPTSMSFSVRCDRSGMEYNGSHLNGLFAQRRNLLRPRFYRLIGEILRFNREAPALLDDLRDEPTVGQYLSDHGYTADFTGWYLLPMGSAIWSCPVQKFSQFPMRFIVEFFRNHGLLSVLRRPTWRVICGGSQSYVGPLTRGFRDSIRLNSPVESVCRAPDRVEVRTARGGTESFDHVVLACHSDQALQILADPSPTEREVLREFPYEPNVAVLHTDPSVLPRSKRAWAAWNYRVGEEGSGLATVTYNMNILQRLSSREVFCVTLNPEAPIDPSRVLRRIVYHHPVFTTRRAAAQSRHRELLSANRTSFCGAYWGNGFHEDGVVSALAVCRALDSRGSACIAQSMRVGSVISG